MSTDDYTLKEARQLFDEYNKIFNTNYSISGFRPGTALNDFCNRRRAELNLFYNEKNKENEPTTKKQPGSY